MEATVELIGDDRVMFWLWAGRQAAEIVAYLGGMLAAWVWVVRRR